MAVQRTGFQRLYAGFGYQSGDLSSHTCHGCGRRFPFGDVYCTLRNSSCRGRNLWGQCCASDIERHPEAYLDEFPDERIPV